MHVISTHRRVIMMFLKSLSHLLAAKNRCFFSWIPIKLVISFKILIFHLYLHLLLHLWF